MRLTISTVVLIVALDSPFMTLCFSQQDTTSQRATRVILTDGSELVGLIVSEDSVSILFNTAGSIAVTIPKNQVKIRELLSGRIEGGQYVRPDPNYTRLFFAPTARALKSGQGYFSAYQIFFPFLAVGIADVVTLAGGMSLIPGAESQIFYFAPKVTPVQIGELSLAGGLLYVNTTVASGRGFGIYYGVGTYGSTSASITAGLGWGFYGSDVAKKPIALIGGEVRASNSVMFITENWLLPNSDINILSFGVRFFGESLAADLGLFYPAGSNITGFPFIPWIGFAYNFGTAR
jgi:hypothetical protein